MSSPCVTHHYSYPNVGIQLDVFIFVCPSQVDVQSKIKDVLAESLHRESETTPKHATNEADILRALRERGVVEDVMKQLNLGSGGFTKEPSAPSKPATHFVNKDEQFAVNLIGKKGTVE